MQSHDSSQGPGAPVQPAGLTAESVSALRARLAFKEQQLQQLQQEVELLQAAVRAPESAQQSATVAAAAAAAAKHQLQALNLRSSSTKSPSSMKTRSPATTAGLPSTRTARQTQCAAGAATAASAGTKPFVQGCRSQGPQQQPPVSEAADQQLPQLQSLKLLSRTTNISAANDAESAELAVTSAAADSTQQLLQRMVTAKPAAAVTDNASAAADAVQAAAAAAVDQNVQSCGLTGHRQPSAAAAVVGAGREVLAVFTPELTAPELAADRLLSASTQQAAAAAAAGRLGLGQPTHDGLQGVLQLMPQQQQQQQSHHHHHQHPPQQQQQMMVMMEHWLWRHQQQRSQLAGAAGLFVSPQQQQQQQPHDAIEADPSHISQLLRSLQVNSHVADLPAVAAADSGRGLGSTPPAELMAAAAARTAAASTAAPAILLPNSTNSSNLLHPRSLHPLVATAAAATAAVTTQAELRRLSNWDNPTLTFKERSQTLVDAAARQQQALGLGLDQITDQDLLLLLQPIELEMAAHKHLGDPIDKSKVVPRERTKMPKVKARGARCHVSADSSSRGGVSGEEEVPPHGEAGTERSSQSGAVISYHEFAQHFHLAAKFAAPLLGMGLTKFKTKIRKIGIKRWPQREYKAIEDATNYLESKADDAKDHAAKPGRILMLRHLRCLLDKYPNMEFDAHPARDLIDAFHKQKYKKRKQEEKGEQLTAAAGADSAPAAAAAAAASGSSCSAGSPGSQCLQGGGTQQQEQTGKGKRTCRRQA